jgi:hypothetical protein
METTSGLGRGPRDLRRRKILVAEEGMAWVSEERTFG